MSRHNRRRHRTGHKASYAGSQSNGFELPLLAAETPESKLSMPRYLKRSHDLSARHWHNRFLAWQSRERKQGEERERLLKEQKRIFGGDSQDGDGDDDGLCTKMMDYFVGLDYLEG